MRELCHSSHKIVYWSFAVIANAISGSIKVYSNSKTFQSGIVLETTSLIFA